ncbi:MAG TPA: hypothetical protein VGK59_22305 [Ohtaekwangia sp.]
MKYLFIIGISLNSWALLGQSTPVGPAAEQNTRTLASSANTDNAIKWFNNRYQGVVGHPFLLNDWQQAEVELADGNLAQTLIKLDISKDELWAVLTTGDSIIVNPGLVRSFSILNHDSNQRRAFEFILGRQPRYSGYFEVLYSGDTYTLLSKRKKEYKPAVISGSYVTGNPYDEFVDEESWYYIRKNNELIFLKLKENTIIDILGIPARKVLKEKNLDLKKESDIVELVKGVDVRANTTP